MANLEHLDVRNAEVEISGVAEDERATEEKANGENGSHEHILCHVYILCAIEQVCRPLKNTSADSLRERVILKTGD